MIHEFLSQLDQLFLYNIYFVVKVNKVRNKVRIFYPLANNELFSLQKDKYLYLSHVQASFCKIQYRYQTYTCALAFML